MDEETQHALVEMLRETNILHRKTIEHQQRIERQIATTNQLLRAQQPVIEQINRNLAKTGEAVITDTEHTFDMLEAILSKLNKMDFQSEITASNADRIARWRWGGY